MTDCCVYTSEIAHRQSLRSAGCRQLLVPRHDTAVQCSVAGPFLWPATELLTRLPSRSDAFCWQFSSWPENSSFLVFSERELTFTFAICRRPSVCLSVVCNVRAPYLGYWNFRQCFYAIWYRGHLRPFDKNFTEIVLGKPPPAGIKPKRGSQI